MKVLFIVGYYAEIGGPYSVVLNLTKALYSRGIKCGVYSLLPKVYDRSKLKPSDCIDELMYLEEDKSIVSHFWPSFSKSWKNLLDKINKYDLIYVFGIFDYYAFFVSKYVKKPYIISPQGTLMKGAISRKSYFLKSLYMLIFGKKILMKAKIVHVLTRQEKLAIREFGVPAEKIYIVPNGIDPELFLKDIQNKDLLLQRAPFLKNKKIILFLSRMNWKKGLDDLIPAFSDVIKKIMNVHLLLVGPGQEDYIAKVHNLIRKYKLSNYVSYIGPAYGNEKLVFYKEANIYILPSYSEGFPITVLEAMYMKLPVIITKGCNISEIIEGSKCGLVINKKRNEISKAIIYLMNNEHILEELGERGRDYIERNLLWSSLIDKIIQMFKKAIEYTNDNNK